MTSTALVTADTERTRACLALGQFATNTNDSASAGNFGEFQQSLVALGSAIALTNATAANVTSLALTPGDWDVEGNINLNEVGCTRTQGSAGISTVSATIPSDGSEIQAGMQHTTVTAKDAIELTRKRISLAANTTVYLVVNITFSAGTCSAYGVMTARRVR